MDTPKSLGITILKSTILTTTVIWLFVFEEGFDIRMIGYILLSVIPICIPCCLAIVFTILPFFWFTKDGTSKKIIFEKYFPFYSIAVFLFFLIVIINSDFEGFLCVFFLVAFFILMQSWIWLCKPDKKEIQKIKIEEEKVS